MASVRKRGRISKDDFTGMGHVKWTLDNSWGKKDSTKRCLWGKIISLLKTDTFFSWILGS